MGGCPRRQSIRAKKKKTMRFLLLPSILSVAVATPVLIPEHVLRLPLRLYSTNSVPSPPQTAPTTLRPFPSRARTPRRFSAHSANENPPQEVAYRPQIQIIGIPARIRVWSFYGPDRMWGSGSRLRLARGMLAFEFIFFPFFILNFLVDVIYTPCRRLPGAV